MHCFLADFPCRLVPFDPARPLPRGACDIEIMELGFALRMGPDEAPAAWLRTGAFRFPPGCVGLCLAAGGLGPGPLRREPGGRLLR